MNDSTNDLSPKPPAIETQVSGGNTTLNVSQTDNPRSLNPFFSVVSKQGDLAMNHAEPKKLNNTLIMISIMALTVVAAYAYYKDKDDGYVEEINTGSYKYEPKGVWE